MLNVIDEFTHECLAIRVARKLKSIDVIDVLSDLFILRGVPGHIRSDNGPEFLAKAVQEWITAAARRVVVGPSLKRSGVSPPLDQQSCDGMQEPSTLRASDHLVCTGFSEGFKSDRPRLVTGKQS